MVHASGSALLVENRFNQPQDIFKEERIQWMSECHAENSKITYSNIPFASYVNLFLTGSYV
jgi:hypothetical protein